MPTRTRFKSPILRLWEIFTCEGNTAEAAAWQKPAFVNKVPGVPEPNKALSLGG